MALIKCPDCGKEISNDACICIGCGRPMKDGASCPYIKNIQKANIRSEDHDYRSTYQPDIATPLLVIVSFVFPVIGLILYLVYRKKYTFWVNSIKIATIIGLVLQIVCFIGFRINFSDLIFKAVSLITHFPKIIFTWIGNLLD